MAEQRRLELESVSPGRKLVIAERSISQRDERYAIRMFGGASMERLEVFSESAMLKLAEFVDPQEDRVAEYRQEIDRLNRLLDTTGGDLAEAREQLFRARRDVWTLVETLNDAWWLHAAEAYRNLKTWVEGK